MSRRWIAWAVDALLMVAVLGVMTYVVRRHVPAGTLRLTRSDWRAVSTGGMEIGVPGGKVSIVEFVDYQCPVCARMEPLLTQLERRFPNKIRRVVRHLPIESIHPQSMAAAKAVECARGQFSARRMHDLLFASQPSMNSIAFDTLGNIIGISDPTAFATCVKKQDHPRIRKDMELASSIGVSGTPTVIVDGLLMTSFSPPLLLSLVKSRLE